MGVIEDVRAGEARRRIAAVLRGQSMCLNLSYLDLDAVPDSIGESADLAMLNLEGNRLTDLPEWITRLGDLAELRLSNNQLTEVPKWVGRLTNLTRLHLDYNQLTEIPDSLGRLTNLVVLGLDGNPRLSSPPPRIREQGAQAVLAFLRARGEAATRLWRSKILVVGEATVGKTSLAKRLRGESFDPHERQTHGVRVHTLRMPHPGEAGIEMALHMWDFGGQLEYRATQRFYLTDQSLFILVWNSRARWTDGKITAWLDAITARAPSSPILIVATHGDEHSPATLPRDLMDRYPQIARTHRIDSRTGSGVESLRRSVAECAAALPLMGAQWPAAWNEAAKAVGDLPGLTATATSVFKHMAKAGVTETGAQRVIARTLHDLGQISHFVDIPDLATKVILKPEWLDARITQAIDSHAVACADGVLSRAERHRLWGDLAEEEDDPNLPDRLVRIMEAFDLAYRLGDSEDSDDVALVVDRLPDSRPGHVDVEWKEQAARPGMNEIGIIYRLASRQAGIPTWFIAREHRYTTGLHWRHGALLHDRDPDTPSWALLVDDGREQPTITLRVVGTYPVRFLSVLTEAFNNIIEDHYPGLVEDRLIPCACENADGRRCDHAFTLRELIAEVTAEEPDADRKVRCPNSRRRIEAALMLDGLRGTGLVAELDALNRKLDIQVSTLADIDDTQLAALNGIRTLLEHRAGAGTHCPALFSIEPAGRSHVLHRESFTLTLWCEWPSGPHPIEDEDGRYSFSKIPPALRRYLPYLRLLINALGLVTPVANTLGADLSDQVTAGIEAAAKTLEFISGHMDAKSVGEVAGVLAPSAHVVRAESGADFRALRDMLHALDPVNKKNWGGLSPVSRPEDRHIIYLCPYHLNELEYPFTTKPATPERDGRPSG